MAKILNSLQTKLIASFILLILVISGMTFLYTFSKTKTALLDTTRDDMSQIIGMISTQFTPQEVETLYNLKQGDETSPQFLSLKTKMQQMRSLSPNIINIYTMRLDNNQISFLIDDLPLEEEPANISQFYDEPEDILFNAVDGIQVSKNTYTDEWGTFLSGYAPLKDSNGKVLVLIGADMQATEVKSRQDFIGNTIYFIISIAILLAAIIIGFFSVTIIKDIKKLNDIANKISTGDTNVTVDIKRKDEIGDLAESFGRMVASLKIMMMSSTEPPKDDKKPKKK